MPLYFQVQFLKLECTGNAKSAIKNALKSERNKKVSSLKHHQGPGKKCKELKRDIIEIHSQEDSIKKGNIRKILNIPIQEIPKPKKEYEKKNCWENPEQKRGYEKYPNIWTTLYEKENMRKTNMTKILNQKKKIVKRCIKRTKKFCQQIRQGPYFICTVCH